MNVSLEPFHPDNGSFYTRRNFVQ